jgi:Recombination endonuclease VII
MRPDKYDNCSCGRRKAKISKHCQQCALALRPKKLSTEERRRRQKEWSKRWRDTHKEQVLSSVRAYQQTEEGRAATRAADRKRYSKERGREARFKYQLREDYRITVDDYDRLFEQQQGRCGVCARAFQARRPWLCADGAFKPCLDHRHDPHLVRGLLCRGCNTAMGIIERDGGAYLQKLLGYAAAGASGQVLGEGNGAVVAHRVSSSPALAPLLECGSVEPDRERDEQPERQHFARFRRVTAT